MDIFGSCHCGHFLESRAFCRLALDSWSLLTSHGTNALMHTLFPVKLALADFMQNIIQIAQ